jgi:hypothetical protein
VAIFRGKNRSRGGRWTGSVPFRLQLRQDMFRNPGRFMKKKKR